MPENNHPTNPLNHIRHLLGIPDHRPITRADIERAYPDMPQVQAAIWENVCAAQEGCGELVELPPDAATQNDHRNPRRRREESANDVGVIVETNREYDDLDRLILHEAARDDILTGLRSIQLRPQLESVWNLSRVVPLQGRCILNFYGPPGTGKTRAARAIAARLGKRLYQVDYSAIISKYLGDTAKHIVAAFKRAREVDAVLFFDEADSLLSKRVNMDQSCATSINQNRNVLMQELDRFNGVVIVTTNLFGNYDEALLRRISRHIEFKLPNRAMRRKLFELHLPNLERVEADLDVVAQASKGLSGGDILNICVNSIFAGSTDPDSANWKVSDLLLLGEVEKVKRAKSNHNAAEAPVNN